MCQSLRSGSPPLVSNHLTTDSSVEELSSLRRACAPLRGGPYGSAVRGRAQPLGRDCRPLSSTCRVAEDRFEVLTNEAAVVRGELAAVAVAEPQPGGLSRHVARVVIVSQQRAHALTWRPCVPLHLALPAATDRQW